MTHTLKYTDNLMTPKPAILVHSHIFKNAGSTFESSLERCFGDRFKLIRKQPTLWREPDLLASLLENIDNVAAISSHTVNLQHMQQWPFQVVPFLILRNPLDRVKSVYNFERKQVLHPTRSAKQAQKLSFPEYVTWSLNDPRHFVISNHQVRFCSGRHQSDLSLEERYQTATSLIDQLPVAGLVEYYDETMVLLEEHLASQGINADLSYIQHNQTQDKSLSLERRVEETKKQLGGVFEQLLSENQLDLALHQYAQQRLEKQIQQQADFEKKLQKFRVRCQHLETTSPEQSTGKNIRSAARGVMRLINKIRT